MSILLPMLAQIGWTFLRYVWLTIARQRAAMRFDLLMLSLELALPKDSKRRCRFGAHGICQAQRARSSAG